MARVLKILHVGDFFYEAKRRAPAGFRVGGKLGNGLIRNGHCVVDFPYRLAGREGAGKYFRVLRRRKIQRDLEACIRRLRPDLLLLGHAYGLGTEFLTSLRRRYPALKMAQWNVDSVFEGSNGASFARFHSLMDASFISTAPAFVKKTLGLSGKVFFFPNPVDLSVETGRAFEQERCRYDVFYSCGNPRTRREIAGRLWDMDVFLERLEQALPKGATYGFCGVRGRPYRSGAEYAALLGSSAIGLNLSRSGKIPFYSSDRLAQIVGNGQLAAMERGSFYERLFSEGEMLFFSTLPELYEKLRFFLGHPQKRQLTARAGREKYVSFFECRQVADYLTRLILGEDGEVSMEQAHPWAAIVNGPLPAETEV